jgi:dTDP-4-amino-4,6-dideoxygalactose transaminase
MIPHSRLSLGQAEAAAVQAVLASGQLAQGPRVEALERGIAAFIGVAGGVAVSSGTAALELALRGLGIEPGDEVVMPSYVCAAPWLAARRAGATVRLVDIDPACYGIDPLEVAKVLSARTRAIIAPHLFGLPADLTGLEALGVPIIEDCAHTLGATEAGRPVGTVGAATVCSFYATKLLCAGEGGMVLSNDPNLLDRVRALREYDERAELPAAAFNYKMTDLHAAVGLQQLQQLPTLLARRGAVAARYNAALGGSGLRLPEPPKGRTHVFYRYVVRLDPESRSLSLAQMFTALGKRGVQCRRPVFRPVHQYLKSLTAGHFAATERVMATAVSVPLYPALTDDEVTHVIKALTEVLAKG